MSAPKPAPPRRRFRSLLQTKTEGSLAMPLLLQDAIVSLVLADDEPERLSAFVYARDHGVERIAVRCTRRICLRFTTATGYLVPGFRELVGHCRNNPHTARDFVLAAAIQTKERTR